MITLFASHARAHFSRLMDQVALSHQPVVISGKRNRCVLVAQEDWAGIQETLFLLRVRKMRESIGAGMAESTESCSTKPGW